ncbi:MAG: hypothetical protein GW808_07390 [Sphingomonadales bacterium]|nr:hypothetical protein [Sphingomonadales bacterium]PIX67494.1 MAG: hypothetical protein COZ43_01155 [Sphingomonadales bacterium CG_4_10_14_3_um_filter_58_15]NCO49596.1 hypothetical protein [Sphingomonadales bacterium]NCP00288.1 hypothetical protein [Sphingomonadales bacterium]NCP25689.1 hypothetical protein [Sphingomonadales bacterium]
MSKYPSYMKRYFIRLMIFISLYMAILIGGLSWMNSINPPDDPIPSVLALLTALPILGVFWTIFRLLVEIDDEYQRFLMTKQIVIGTAMTLAITTVWQFLNAYDVLLQGPQWIGVIWLAMFGIAGGLVRWKA